MKNVEIAEGGIGRRLSGTKFILTDKPESDQMEVWVDEDDRKLARLYATSNGTYYPEDYDAYGFSSVTVSIHGGATLPEMPKIEMPDGTIAPVLIPEIEMPDGTLKPIDELFPEIAEDPLTDIGEVKMPDTVGEEGSAITGLDPEDGYTYKVEVDEAGNLDIEKVPTGISITPPTQTEYEFGQPIDYDGMEVTLVDKDGNTVKTKEYPTGKVPLDELEDDGGLPERAQTKDEVKAKEKGKWTASTHLDIGDVSVTVVGGFSGYLLWNGEEVPWTAAGGVVIYANAGNGWILDSSASPIDGRTDLRYTINGKTAYYGYHGWGFFNTRIIDFGPDVSDAEPVSNDGVAAWAAQYGSMSAEQELSVGWTSPYSGIVYEDGTTVVTSDPYEDE